MVLLMITCIGGDGVNDGGGGGFDGGGGSGGRTVWLKVSWRSLYSVLFIITTTTTSTTTTTTVVNQCTFNIHQLHHIHYCKNLVTQISNAIQKKRKKSNNHIVSQSIFTSIGINATIAPPLGSLKRLLGIFDPMSTTGIVGKKTRLKCILKEIFQIKM